MAKKTSKGKQRIEMKKIENETHLKISFSKRRGGLFKKAGELSTLTGAELAVIAFSPTGKAYAFGSPSVDQVLNQLEHGGGAPIGGNGNGGGEVLRQIDEQREAEKKRAEVAAERAQKRAEEEQSMGLPELIRMRESMEALRQRVAELQAARQVATAAAIPQTFYVGGGGGVIPFATAEFNPFASAGTYAGDPFAAGPSSVGDYPAVAGLSSGGGGPFVAGPSSSAGWNFNSGGFRSGPGGPI